MSEKDKVWVMSRGRNRERKEAHQRQAEPQGGRETEKTMKESIRESLKRGK